MRRRSLLSVVSSRWYPYSYEYLYHNLIPNEVPSFNIFDEETESGGINSTTGQNETDSTRIRGKNYIKVSPNETYYFKSSTSLRVAYYDISKTYIGETNGWKAPQNSTLTIPNNVYFIRIAITSTTTYNHDICINKSNSQLNGIYAPYNPHLVGKKAKLLEIEGNGEIVNQLATTTDLSFLTTDTGGKIITSPFSLIANHKYIIRVFQDTTLTSNTRNTIVINVGGTLYELLSYGSSTGTFSLNAWVNQNLDKGEKYAFFNCSSSALNGILQYWCQGASNDLNIKVNITDLTQDYGTGREPTSVTDPRIRRIIENGYIEKNDGTYRSSVVDSLVTRGFNIWDEEWEVGGISWGPGTNYNDSKVRSKNYIKVNPNTIYYFKTPSALDIHFYDNDKQHISAYYMSTAGTFTTPTNCCYIRFMMQSSYGTTYNHDICINVSSSLNGTYKPYREPQSITLPAPIQLDGALDSHSIFEITNTEYVFTRDNWKYTFTGNEGFASISLGRCYCNKTALSPAPKTPTSRSEKANLFSNNFVAIADDFVETNSKQISLYGGSITFCLEKSSSAGDVSALLTYLQNNKTTLYYQLATPQITRIPRGRLGAYTFKGNETFYVQSADYRIYRYNLSGIEVSTNIAEVDVMLYPYLQNKTAPIGVNQPDMTITVYNGTIYIRDNSCASATDLVNKLAGIPIFFKTATEVPDFINQAQTEAGGTINGAEFSWVKNQLVTNGNFESTSGWTADSLSVNNNVATFTAASQYGALDSYITLVSSHYYLLKLKIKLPSANYNARVGLGDNGYFTNEGVQKSLNTISNTDWNDVYVLGKYTKVGTRQKVIIMDFNSSNFASIQVKEVNVIDLTLAFQDDIPTSINDPRIQYIIEHGYVETDTTGTYENVTTQTLANVNVGVK